MRARKSECSSVRRGVGIFQWHQPMVLRRQVRGPADLNRLFVVQLYHWFPSILRVVAVFSRRLSFVGIGPAFAATGGRSRVRGRAADRG